MADSLNRRRFVYASTGEHLSLCSIDESPEGAPGPSCGSIAENVWLGGGRPVWLGRPQGGRARGGHNKEITLKTRLILDSCGIYFG